MKKDMEVIDLPYERWEDFRFVFDLTQSYR